MQPTLNIYEVGQPLEEPKYFIKKHMALGEWWKIHILPTWWKNRANLVHFGDSLKVCKVMSSENMTLPNKVNNCY